MRSWARNTAASVPSWHHRAAVTAHPACVRHADDVRRKPAGPQSDEAVTAAFAQARSRTALVTLYMCWHGGIGHDEYPPELMEAAKRLRDRHGEASHSDDDYTILDFEPSAEDWDDFLRIAPYCDLAYAIDLDGEVVATTPT